MPLAFPSLSHGTIAFGFFNIEIDMLLLEELFFFAEPFCMAVADLVAPVGSTVRGSELADEVSLPGYRIEDPAARGNVNLAIARVDISGFIGETYRRFPFPDRPEGFKQKPHAESSRPWARATVLRYGEPMAIPIRRDRAGLGFLVGEYEFDEAGFGALVAYVDRGGYPRWEGDIRPAYVTAMMTRLAAHRPPPLPADTP